MIKASKLLPWAFVFAGVVALLDRAFNDEMRRLAVIRQDFIEAVSDARGRLTNNLWAALSDLQIQQNLELGNMNTVTQALQGYVRPGEVSQLDLYDSSCNLISRVPQNGKPVNSICEAIQLGKPVLKWQINEQKEPVLVALAPKNISGQVVTAAAQLVFDQSWLSLHHGLSKLAAEREISFSGGADLWREGAQPDGRFALVLRVDGWLYRLVPELTGLALVPVRENFWLVFGALGVIMLLALSEMTAEVRKSQKERTSFEVWIKEQFSTKSPDQSTVGAEAPSWIDLLASTKVLFSAKDDQKAHQVRLMQERLENLTTRIRERELESADLRRRFAEMSVMASLQQQLRYTTTLLTKQMGQIRDVCETIEDLANGGLSLLAKDLQIFFDRWKKGLEQGTSREMSARKFFRSLVETPGKITGKSQLDDDMRQLEALTHAAQDQYLHTAILARRVVDGCESAAQMTNFWHGIVTNEDSDKTSDWISCLVTAQKLLKADERYSAITFEMIPQLENPEEMYPAVGVSALTVGFFHLYLAILSDSDPAALNMPIVIRQKRLKDQATIILSLPSKRSDLTPEVPTRQMGNQVEIARQILSAFGLKVSILPPTIAGYPVGLTWSLPKRQLTSGVLQDKKLQSTESPQQLS